YNTIPFLVQAMSAKGGLQTQHVTTDTWWSAIIIAGLNVGAANSTGNEALLQAMSCSDWVVSIFNSLMPHPAVAPPAIITSIGVMGYYDHVAQYDNSAPTTQVFFVSVPSGGGPNGRKRTATLRGLVAVILVFAVHFILVIAIVVGFIVVSKLTRIGDGWQAI